MNLIFERAAWLAVLAFYAVSSVALVALMALSRAVARLRGTGGRYLLDGGPVYRWDPT